MSTVGKVIIGVGTAFLLIVVIIVGGVFYWWSYGGGKQMANDTVNNIEKSEKDGEAFGKTVESDACIDKALEQDKSGSTFNAALSSQIFLQGCLKTSRETPGFCVGVPKMTQIIDGPKWQVQKCREHGAANDPICPQVFQKVQEHCEMKR